MKVWDGPTPYDNSDWSDASPNAIKEAYRAAKNDDMAMYEALLTGMEIPLEIDEFRSMASMALTAYEAGLKETE